jgi:hypothetical protein
MDIVACLSAPWSSGKDPDSLHSIEGSDPALVCGLLRN